MRRQTARLAQQELIPKKRNTLLQHTAVRPLAEQESVANSAATGLARDFTQVPVLPQAQTAGRNTTRSCPMSPQRCPFGGACHACPPKVQAKLKIGQPGDKYEQEADRVAEQVMRMPEPQVQRKCSAPGCKGEDDEKKLLQTKPANAGEAGAQVDHPLIQNVLASPGQPLDAGMRSFMEPRFGQDFSGVRVHMGGTAAESARAVNARAYTVGRDVVFGEGQYAPGSDEGRKLVAHELAHVGQQTLCKGTLKRIQREIIRDPRASIAAQKAYEMKQQTNPGIWFDDWDDDERDNDLGGVIDDSVNESGTDGIHSSCKGKGKCKNGIWEAEVCKGSLIKRTDSCVDKQHHYVKYRVCIDIPKEAYHAAGLSSFPTVRWVSTVKQQLSSKSDWKVFYYGPLLDGDFVANSQHSGIVYQDKIIHLSGQTGRRSHYGSVFPSRKNDIEMTGSLWHGGVNFIARPINRGSSNVSESVRSERKFEGLRRNDGIIYGTWDRRPRVRDLQRRLTDAGFPCDIDGMFGPETTNALHGFQSKNDLPDNEHVDRPTATALNSTVG